MMLATGGKDSEVMHLAPSVAHHLVMTSLLLC